MKEQLKEVQRLYDMGIESLQGCGYMIAEIVINNSYQKKVSLERMDRILRMCGIKRIGNGYCFTYLNPEDKQIFIIKDL